MNARGLTQEEIDCRMDEAAQAEQQGDYRTAARLYDALGKDIQNRLGRFDSRALDAYEAMCRVIGGSAGNGRAAT